MQKAPAFSLELYTAWDWSPLETFHKDDLTPPFHVVHYTFSEVLGCCTADAFPFGQIWLFCTCSYMSFYPFFCLSTYQSGCQNQAKLDAEVVFYLQVSEKRWGGLNWICKVRRKMWGSSCSTYKLSSFIFQGSVPFTRLVFSVSDSPAIQDWAILSLFFCVFLLQLSALWAKVPFLHLLSIF